MDHSGLRQLDIGFPVPEVNALALPERKVFKPIYQMGKWFARRSSAVFRALLLAAALPADPPDDFKVCVRAMLKERRASRDGEEPSDEEVDREARRLYLMAMFYRNNQQNPFTKGLIVLDPFMGGGTTIVEAARLGMKPIGVDLNPVAWLITKTELEPVSIPPLKQAFEQLRNHPVALPDPAPAGVPTTLEKFIKHWYTTRCPSCGGDAELVYALWVKRHRCLNALCQAPEVRFFKNYLVTQKDLRVSYIEDCICPGCSTEEDPKTFDWELEPASLLFLPGLDNQIAVPGLDAGSNRKIHGGGHKIRWACASWPGPVRCPHCEQDVVPTHRLVLDNVNRKEGKETRTCRRDPIAFGSQPIVAGKHVQTKGKSSRLAGRETPKIVKITVFYNPTDQALWEYRGEVPTMTTPRPWFESGKKKSDAEPEPRPYVPMPDGTRLWLDEGTENDGEYICSGSQAHRSTIFEAGTKRLKENKRPTPFEMDCYAIEGYCPHCGQSRKDEGEDGGAGVNIRWVKKDIQPSLFQPAQPTPAQGQWEFGAITKPLGSGLAMSAANARFFKTPGPADLRKIEQAETLWEETRDVLVWPQGHAIPYGYNTRVGNDLWVHGYHDWADAFTKRQLLAYGQLIKGVKTLSGVASHASNGGSGLIDLFCNILMSTLNNNSILWWYDVTNKKTSRVFAQHHFQPKVMVCEGPVWGGKFGQGTFVKSYEVHLDAVRYKLAPFDRIEADTMPTAHVPLGLDPNKNVRRAVDLTEVRDGKRLDATLALRCGESHQTDACDPALLQQPVILSDKGQVYPWDSFSQSSPLVLRSRPDFARLAGIADTSVGLIAADCRELRSLPDGVVDLVITDPPFGDNVNYGELSDFFYVWLAPILKDRYFDARGNDLFDHWEDEIMPKDRAEKDGIGFTEDPTLPPGFVRRRRLLQTPKQAEIIESRASQQTKTARDYNDSLRAAFAEAHRKLKPDGIMTFTFHHNDVHAWWAVVAALLECVPLDKQGFHLEAVYPIVGEAETTTHHHEKQNATFDIIHVCRKRTALPTKIKWAMFRRKVREAVRRKREELLSVPAYNPQVGGYVSRNDLRMILLGVGFQLYSEHYGQVEFPRDFLRLAQAAPRGRRGKRTVAQAAELLFEEARQHRRRASDPADDPSARNLCELTYAIDEILDEIEHGQANPLPPELESLAGEVDRISRYYFKYLVPEHGRTIKYDDLKQLEYRTGVAVKDLTDADVLTTRHRNREYEIKRPSERYRRLRERFLDERTPLGILDRAHFLIGAIDDAAWAERNKVDPVRIDEFLVEGKPIDEAWADEKDQLIAAIRMIAAHTADDETKAACGRALKWLAPAVDLFTPTTARASAGEGNG